MDVKEDMIGHLKSIQKGIEQLQQTMEEKVFNLCYMHFFQGIACHVIAEQYFVDKSTIVKYNQKFILKLSAILYPQYFEWMKIND